MTAPGGITRVTLLKDLRLEWRSKDAINSMLFFSLLVVVVFSFSFDPSAEESRQIAGGLIWVAFLFAAVVALNQTWAREIRNQVLDAYRVSPAPPNSLFMAKVTGNFIFVTLLEALMTPLFVVFYRLRSLGPMEPFSLPCLSAPAAARSCCLFCSSRFRFLPSSPWCKQPRRFSTAKARGSGSYCL
jgi:heme exporter protein CcmB